MRQTEFGRCGWVGKFCGRQPLLVAALVAAASVAVADWQPVWGVLAGGLCGLAGWWLVGWRTGLMWLLCGWVAAGGLVWRDGVRGAAARELLGEPGGVVRARVLKDAQGGGRFWSAPARLLDGRAAGVQVVWQGRGVAPVAGAVVTAGGHFGPLPEPRNPGEFNRAAWLRRQGVAAVFHTVWGEHLETGRLARWGAALRHGFRDRMTAGLAEDSQEANVIRAVVIGEVPPDADALIGAFRNSGTLHVFSVSGLHVAMVGSIGWLLLSWAGVSRRWAVIALLPLFFGYSWLTGNSAPAVRSAWMAAVFLGAFGFRRRPDLLNALGAVLLAAMLWDGQLLFQAGVQLSYGVVAAIAVGSALTGKLFAWLAVAEPYLPESLMTRWQTWWFKLRRSFAQTMGVSLAAAVGSAPLTAFHFGLITPVSVVANLVLIPLVFVLLVAGLAAVALSPVAPVVSRGVNRLNGLVANASVLSAEVFAAIPGGHCQVGRDRRPRLVVYDLGHGAGAACFAGGASGAVLLDCGDRQSFQRCVMPSLRQLGIEPDAVVISHPDGGHLGGGAAVWAAFPIKQVLLPVRQAQSPVYKAWLLDAPKAGVRIHQASVPGWCGLPDGAALEILHVPDPQTRREAADNRVMVYRIKWRGWKLLFTSDAGMTTEQKLLDGGSDVAADVLIAGHNRSDLALGDRFLEAVNPQVIIASNAQFPAEEKLDSNKIAYWQSRGIKVFDQAATGGVTLRVDAAGRLCVEGFLSGVPLVLNPR